MLLRERPMHLPAGSMRDKTCVVSGATAGIGECIARELARADAQVIVVARDAARAQATCRAIAEHSVCAPRFIVCDLAEPTQIERAGSDLRGMTSKVDILVNNAGALFAEHQHNSLGWERSFALNHMGYFLLARQCLPLMPKGSRMINIASESHRVARLDMSDLAWQRRRYVGLLAYAASKLANVLFTKELARRNADLLVHAMCPGPVRSNFAMDGGGLTGLGYRLAGFAMKSPEQGASTALHLCATAGNQSGGYYRNGRIATPSSAVTAAAAHTLWQRSLDLTGGEEFSHAK